MLNKLNIKKSTIIIFLLAIISKILYEYQVIYCLPEYYMPGVTFYKDLDISKLFIGWFVFIIFLVTLIVIHKEDFRHYVIEVLFFLNLLPATSSYGLNNADTFFFIQNMIYWVFLLISISLFNNVSVRKHNIKLFFIRYEYVAFIGLVFILIVLFVYKYNHFHISFNLADVYDVREEMKGLPIWFSWIKNSFGNIGLPFLIVYFLTKKRYFIGIISLFMEILLFSVGMDKTYLLLLFISVFLGFCNFRKIKNVFSFVSFGIFIAMAFSFLEYILKNTFFLFYLIIRRTFYVPMWMNQLYFDFFSKNEKVVFTQSVFLLSKLFPDTYETSIYTLINNNYFLGKMSSPNTGMFAESYMHLGVAGVFVFPILVVLILFLTDILLEKCNKNCKFMISISIGLLISNIPVTGGFFVSSWLVFIFLLFLHKNYINKMEIKI